jgi:TRAP-type C4-dicarboxylate transport system permease small subunit
VIVVRSIKKASDAVDMVCTAISVFLLGVMTVVTFIQIICRVFFSALFWTEEVARYALVWITFIGAGCVHKRAGHISITILQDLLPGKARKVFQILTQLLCIIVFLTAIYYGFSYMQLMGTQLSAALRIPMRYMYAIIPVGCIIMMMHSTALITKKKTKREAETK